MESYGERDEAGNVVIETFYEFTIVATSLNGESH